MAIRVLALLAGLGLALGSGLGAARAEERPSEAASRMAILIVGNEANAEMLREEKALIAEMTRLLTGRGEPEATREKYAHVRTLQVYSYHFNQPRERQYCEKKLNVLEEDLLFIGLVELKDRLPRRVLYRLDRITRARRAAEDVLARGEEMLAPPAPDEEPSAQASPASPAPEGSPSPKGSESPATTWRVQVGSFAELANAQDLVARLKAKGHESRIDHSTRNGTSMFRVYVGSFPTRQEAQATLDRLKTDGFEKAFLAAPEEG